MRKRALLLSLLISSGAAGAVATRTNATSPGRNGLIAFTRYRLQNKPLWSEIFVSRPDGSRLRRVSHSATAVEDDQAHWSPDGRSIVFDRCTANGPCAVWTVRPDGTGQRRLSPPCRPRRDCADESNPSFTPDGRHVLLQHEWGNVRKTPQGNQIEHSAIAERTLDGKHLTLLRRLDGYKGDLEAPRSSPDGGLLLFDGSNADLARPAGGHAIFVAPIAGGPARRITPWRLRAPSADWSPTGKEILFKSSIDDFELTPGTNLYTVGADGSRLRQLTRVGAYDYVLAGSFSPDGRSIVFATNEGATGSFADIFTMKLNGDRLAQVTRSENLDGWPTWGSTP